MRYQTFIFAILVTSTVRAAPDRPAFRPPVEHFEAERFSGPWAAGSEREGFLGAGYRVAKPSDRPSAIDRTIFVFSRHKGGPKHIVWVRALAEPKRDQRVAVEVVGQKATVRLEPTHVKPGASGFHWQRAGQFDVKETGNRFIQVRLHSIERSEPIVDAVLLSTDAAYAPSEGVRPVDDTRLTNGDGEGRTRVSQETLTAGSLVELRVEYTVGKSGIAEGGALRFFVPQSWSQPQTRDPKDDGYVTSRCERTGVELKTTCYPVGRGARAFSAELRHQYECWVRVVEGGLAPGDAVTITYGDRSQGGSGGRVQAYIQSAADFRNEILAWYSPALPLGLSTDANGDGVFWTLPADRSHRLRVVAGPPKRLVVVAPSIVAVDETFELRVAAVDEYNNAAADNGRPVPLSCDLLSLEGKPTGTFRTPGSIGQPGTYAVRVRTSDGLTGLSNAVKCVANEPAHRLYWGDLHCHHRRCDGLRSFEEAAVHARDVALLDVLALSPHACYITDNDLRDLWAVDDRLYVPGRFATIYAYEWAAGGRGASHSVIYSERPMPLCFRAFGGGNVVRGRPALWKLLDQHELDVTTVPHHVRGVAAHHPRYQRAFEIYSQWGTHEAGVVANLDAGAKVCFFGASDNHTGQPGLQSDSNRWAIHHHLGGLTAFAAKQLNRQALFEAIRSRRCYATSACRIIGDFRVNGCAMGGELRMDSPSKPRTIEIEAISSVPVSKVVLHCNGEPIRQWASSGCVARVRHQDQRTYGGPTDHYHVRVEREDGRIAWLTPIWVDFAKPVTDPRQHLLAALTKAKNLALAKPVTASYERPTHGKFAFLTDGKLNDHVGHGVKGRVWMQVDLGQVTELAHLRLWHYFRDRRTYHHNKVALSPTGEFKGEETIVFDSDKEGEYPESGKGRVFSFDPVQARYIRNWTDASTGNVGNQWVELEAFGPLGGAPVRPATTTE